MISIRIGNWLFQPDFIFLPVAGIFFAVVTARVLYPGVVRSRGEAWVVVILAGLAAVLGSRSYGLVQPWYMHEPVLAGGAWMDLRFGSLGGIIAPFLAVAPYAALRGQRVPLYLDALVPGLCAGGFVARISCLFQNCCQGIANTTLSHAGIPPGVWWPALDLASFAMAGGAVYALHRGNQRPREGVSFAVFCVVYGTARMTIESMRNTYAVWGPLTGGHLLAALLVAMGIGQLLLLTPRVAAEPTEPQ